MSPLLNSISHSVWIHLPKTMHFSWTWHIFPIQNKSSNHDVFIQFIFINKLNEIKQHKISQFISQFTRNFSLVLCVICVFYRVNALVPLWPPQRPAKFFRCFHPFDRKIPDATAPPKQTVFRACKQLQPAHPPPPPWQSALAINP